MNCKGQENNNSATKREREREKVDFNLKTKKLLKVALLKNRAGWLPRSLCQPNTLHAEKGNSADFEQLQTSTCNHL